MAKAFGLSELERFKKMGERWMPRSMVNDKRINRMYNYLIREPKDKALKISEEYKLEGEKIENFEKQ